MAASTDTYRKHVGYLTDEIVKLENQSHFDSFILESVQDDLDKIEAHCNKDEIGKSYYKLYELQARIFIMKSDYSQARIFLQGAFDQYGGIFPDYEWIYSKIDKLENESYDNTNSIYKKAVRSEALTGLVVGIVIAVIGGLLTLWSYISASHNPSSDGHYTYFVFKGLLIIGGIRVLTSVYKMINPGDYTDVIKRKDE